MLHFRFEKLYDIDNCFCVDKYSSGIINMLPLSFEKNQATIIVMI